MRRAECIYWQKLKRFYAFLWLEQLSCTKLTLFASVSTSSFLPPRGVTDKAACRSISIWSQNEKVIRYSSKIKSCLYVQNLTRIFTYWLLVNIAMLNTYTFVLLTTGPTKVYKCGRETFTLRNLSKGFRIRSKKRIWSLFSFFKLQKKSYARRWRHMTQEFLKSWFRSDWIIRGTGIRLNFLTSLRWKGFWELA